jgi:Dolichyl-phosphate-mannose-protein mannosyltransferase
MTGPASLESRMVGGQRVLLATAAAVVLLCGIWWGLPGLPNGWAADELNPFSAYDGLQLAFAHGWHDAVYPPLHFYLLALIELPVLGLYRVAGTNIHQAGPYTALYVLCRAVTVAAGVGVVLLVARCARQLFTARAALLAGIAMMTVPPFVYYGKTANVDVPYVFWFLVSMVCFLRAAESHEARAYFGLTIAAACAIGTKDQAYALYPLLPIPLWIGYLQRSRAAPEPDPWWRVLRRWPMIPAAVTGVVALAMINNLAFNWAGAVERFHLLVGPASQPYREFPGTVAGQMRMLVLGARHLRWAFGWPGLAALVAGLVAALTDRSRRALAVALLVPAASYWIFFVMPLGYHYDRFLLPVFAVLAPFAGYGADRLWREATRWFGAAPATVLALAFVAYQGAVAVSVDAWMVQDARYPARAWLATHVPAGARVMGIGNDAYLPHLYGYDAVYEARPSRAVVAAAAPAAIVTSSAYGRNRFSDDPDALDLLRALDSGQAGYRLAAQFDRPPGALIDLRGIRSNFDKISPRVRVYLPAP